MPDAAAAHSTYWSGYALPLVGANSIDGLGLGVGGEVFERESREGHGYRVMITASTYETLTLHYTSQYAQLEVRGDTSWIVRGGYQTWNDLPYAGAGGRDVSTLWTEHQELGNVIHAPYAMVALAHPIARSPWRGYGQVYLHPALVVPLAGGLLATRAPYGADGGWYGDLSFGAEHDTTDRWPVPDRGARTELGLRAGGSVISGGIEPLFGVYGEDIRWFSLLDRDRLVVGFRTQGEKSFGLRPVWEQGVTGGRWRDEIGFEQTLAGYGRIRTRGDGLMAEEAEVRPHFGTWNLPWFSLDLYGSLFAEIAWLYDGNDPGPPMPTVGFGPEVLYQRASQLRPFVAWGWRSEEPGGPRRPVPLFGLSVMDPL